MVMQSLANAHGMSEDVWQRHTNPWSGWTRVPILPLLALSIWARAWIGWWCLLPIALLLLWTWLNPRAFPAPKSTKNWISHAVFGERIWLARKSEPVPAHHVRAVLILTFVGSLGLLPLIWGLWRFEAWAVLAGLTLIFLGKLWFLDRMVWLYADMSRTNPAYAAWDR